MRLGSATDVVPEPPVPTGKESALGSSTTQREITIKPSGAEMVATATVEEARMDGFKSLSTGPGALTSRIQLSKTMVRSTSTPSGAAVHCEIKRA